MNRPQNHKKMSKYFTAVLACLFATFVIILLAGRSNRVSLASIKSASDFKAAYPPMSYHWELESLPPFEFYRNGIVDYYIKEGIK